MNTKQKYVLGAILFILVFLAGFWALNKSLDNRCDYYKSLPNYSIDKELVNVCGQ